MPASSARFSLMMFLQFFIWGAWYVSMTGWMNAANIGGLTGWAYTVGPIAAVVSPFFLGIVADRFFPTQRVLGAMHLLGGAALLAVPILIPALNRPAPNPEDATFFHPYILLLLAHMLCYMPTLGLTNTICFHHMSRPEAQFPLVRVFGTIGWIAGNIAVGGNLRTWGLDIAWIADGDKSPLQFAIAGSAALLLGLYSFTLPHTPPPAAGRRASLRDILGLDSLRLLAQPSYTVFIACSLLICIPLAGYYAYARTFVEAVGFPNPTFTMSYGQMSEILFMLLLPAFFARLGVKWMLATGMLAWVARYGLFAAAADHHIKWMVLAGIILHGVCYDFFFVTGSIYVDKKAPREIRAQAQGFLVLVTQGLGLGLGAQVFSRLASGYTIASQAGPETDWTSVWRAASMAAAAVLVLFVVLFRDRHPASADR
jgi:nucleoside transporter